MSLLTVNSLTKSFGAFDLFTNLTFSVERGARIGLVGPNGVGKTTLLRVIIGEDESSAGNVSRARGLRIGYLSQEADFQMEGTLWDACHSVFAELIRQQENLHRLEEQMATDPDIIEQYGKITKIERDRYGKVILTLAAFGKFDGHYIGGKTETTERADDCWI